MFAARLKIIFGKTWGDYCLFELRLLGEVVERLVVAAGP